MVEASLLSHFGKSNSNDPLSSNRGCGWSTRRNREDAHAAATPAHLKRAP